MLAHTPRPSATGADRRAAAPARARRPTSAQAAALIEQALAPYRRRAGHAHRRAWWPSAAAGWPPATRPRRWSWRAARQRRRPAAPRPGAARAGADAESHGRGRSHRHAPTWRSRKAEADVRLAYVRALRAAQRYAEADAAARRALTREQPDLAGAWLTLGALQLELQPAAARPRRRCKRYVRARRDAARADGRAADDDDEDARRLPRARAHAGLAAAGAGRRAAQRLRGRRALAGQDRQPAARARGAGAPRLAAGTPGQAGARRAS